MKRIEHILTDSRFRSLLAQIELAEHDRIFCCHGLNHLTDVARIAWIDVLENSLPLDKPVVYAAALLHDLGRAAEYAGQGDHNTAAMTQQRALLLTAGFSDADTERILCAIADHRSAVDSELLTRVLKRADRLSRPCHTCPAAADCYWPPEKRNRTITV